MKKYNVIYADCPWSYTQKSVGRGNKSGASDTYSVMTLEDIKNMPINNITSDNSILFLWITTPLLDQGFEVIKSWGFKYKTLITWEKTGCLGMGNYLRTQTEFILIAVKGKIKPFGHQEKNIYKHKIGKHSQKPVFFRDLVSLLSDKSFGYGNSVKLELFARSREGMFPDIEYEGWDVFGNEVNNSIKL